MSGGIVNPLFAAHPHLARLLDGSGHLYPKRAAPAVFWPVSGASITSTLIDEWEGVARKFADRVGDLMQEVEPRPRPVHRARSALEELETRAADRRRALEKMREAMRERQQQKALDRDENFGAFS